MQQTSNLAKAIIAVMQSVKGIEKSMTIGTGNNAYKGVSDKDVKNILGDAMAANGLCILPIDTDAKVQIDRWEAPGYNNSGTVQKQQVFTEVKTKYLLLHTSGESMELSGYGHGVDSQDKAAGKATTYALKYALLYLFLVPTGKIDDADNTHSDNYEPPVKQPVKKSLTNAAFIDGLLRIENGETELIQKLKDAFTLTADQLDTLASVTPKGHPDGLKAPARTSNGTVKSKA